MLFTPVYYYYSKHDGREEESSVRYVVNIYPPLSSHAAYSYSYDIFAFINKYP